MAFLNNKKFSEIYNASKNNDEKALMIMQAYRKGGNQEDLDRLVNDYYAIPNVEPVVNEDIQEMQVETEQPINNVENVEPQQEIEKAQEIETPQIDSVEPQVEIPQVGEPQMIEQPMAEPAPQLCDISELLDNECDGLFDENEIDDIDFATFLGNKRRDNNRAKKNIDYFTSFDADGRAKWVQAKKDNYKLKFGDKLHDIDRQFNDYDKSIDLYTQNINDSLVDELDFNNDNVGNAYNDIMDNNGIMHSFGRHWDNVDTEHIVNELKDMCAKYGKKNVLGALNLIKSDNSNYKDYRLGQINNEVERYNKALDKALIK